MSTPTATDTIRIPIASEIPLPLKPMKSTMKVAPKNTATFLARLAGSAVLWLATASGAATFQWTNTAASASFVNPANWTNTASPFDNGTPGAADNGINNIAGTAAVIADGDSVTAVNVEAQAGAIEITGGNLTASNVLRSSGTNVVRISGGVVSAVNLQVSAVGGAVNISGGDVSVPTDGRIAAANGAWNISGGTVNFNKIVIGNGATTSNALVTVSGNAVVSHNQADFSNIQRQLWLGGNNGGSGTLILKDNASWTVTQTLLNDANGNPICVIGNANSGSTYGQGVLTIQNNASFYYANRIRLGRSGPNSGTINLNGGMLSATGLERQSGSATFNANGGKVVALADQTSFFMNFTNAINIQAGRLGFDSGGFAVTITNVLAGVGGLTKQGSGILTLSGANTYTGTTTNSSDTLRLTGAGSLNTSSGITVENFGTLELTNVNNTLFSTGAFTLNNGTVTANFANTNLTVGTLGTAGFANNINIVALPNVASLPAQIRLIKYTTAAPGLVDGNNVLTALNAGLPTLGNPSGYLTNNVANQSIDLVITSMVLTPVITKQPVPDSAYAGYFAHFAVELEITNSPGYQWRKGGVNLSNGGAYAGVNTAVLKVSNVSASELGNYDVIVSNVSGSVTSAPAALTFAVPMGYEAAAVTAGPAALYSFDDLNDPSTSTAVAYDFAGDFDGVYGTANQNGLSGIVGPTPADGYPGFDATNTAVRSFGFTLNSRVTIPALNLNTNTVTFIAWMNPGTVPANAGIVFCRGAGTTAGFNFTGNTDALARRTLGYTWNNEGGTFGWNSGLGPTPGLWSFVALVVTPTNATVYIFETNALRVASQNYPHVVQSFSTNSTIGDDAFSGGNRQFDGSLDGVGIYAKAMTQSELEAIYAAGSGVSTFAPVIWTDPVSQNRYEQQSVTFNGAASGSQPITYQWQTTDGVNYFDVVNGGRISGATTPTLTISNLVVADSGTMYVLVANNAYGSTTSVVATLTVNATSPAENITNLVVQSGGQSWETGANWSDGLPASVSAASKPGSTYYVPANTALRSPANLASATFPGNMLEVQGNGNFAGTIPGSGTSALILKSSNGGIVNFPKLIMNGGQIFNFVDSGGSTVIGGEVNVIANTPVFASEDTSARSIRIDAKLTGNGTIEYRGYSGGGVFQPTWVSSLNIAGTNNTYTGTWNVLIGTLVASATNSLGTNTITVATNGAIQANYHLNNPDGALILDGRFNLTRNHTFKSVTVTGTPLSAGTYTFAQLNAAYPANFPATWTGQPGALSETTAAGSITVIGSGVTPISLTNTWNGTTLTLNWPSGWMLLEATNVLGPWTTNLTATSPLNVSPTEPQKFFRLQAQ
jgi:autotransporter-associated beta strand protein